MIPIEVENRIATYFFHRFRRDEVMEQIVKLLLPLCLEADEEEDLYQEDIVIQAVTIIEDQLEGKSFK
ncbi:hypothetical protein [Bacillus sp. es.034]|uniref:hypothetical protein n=1 Tax=Bacillus sp. es.034 TaxID=1761763 RepID=UPI000BF380C3|nr:hypothetical protein [Bacillus sp. es.034]PFG04488.1 hypothetical protein ATG71_1234 [Bacillus sp. es.034]